MFLIGMFIPVKVLIYLDSKIFYYITNFNLLTTYLKVKMLGDLFSLRTEYYQFHLTALLINVSQRKIQTVQFRNIYKYILVGKGVILPPFLRFHPFLEIQDVPTFHRSIGKTKVLNNTCNQFVHIFYPQSILIVEECLKKC